MEAFRGKVVADAGAGSGMQTRWLHEAGAAKGIALELLHAVDDIIKENLRGLEGVDVVQCSIDHPTIQNGAVGGMVIYHNVIQHHKADGEIRSLVDELQPDSTKVLS